MRKYVLILTGIWFFSFFASAQSRSIAFEPGRSWSKVVKKAKAENKIIFVDCYTSWCGPCKKLASEVFTQDKVADFFNAHFVNVQFDMEKDDDGKSHMQSWGVASFPTLMFIDPATEQPVGKLVGAGTADWLIEGAKGVLDPSKRIDAMAARYNAGERNEVFLRDFIKVLGQAGMNAQVEQVAKEWLQSLPIEKLATPQIWPLIMQFENDPLSKVLLTVRDSVNRFYAIPLQNQRVMVDAKLGSAMVQTAMEFATSPNLAAYSQERYNAFVDYLAQMPDSPAKAASSVWLNTSLLSRQGNWKQMLAIMHTVKNEKILPDQIFGQYFVFFVKSLSQMKDQKDAIRGGIDWLDGLISEEQGQTLEVYQMKAALYAGKASLWQELGKGGEVKKAQKEMERYMEMLKNAASVTPISNSPVTNSAKGSLHAIMTYDETVPVPVIQVKINGHNYRFLFDTCAGYTCVSDKLVNAEKLNYQQTGNTIHGMEGALVMASIPQIMLGEMPVLNKEAAVLSGKNPIFQTLGVDGIIGANIINDFVLEIGAGKIVLSNAVDDSSVVDWDSLKLWNTDPLLTIKVKGKDELYDVPALLDTGNGTGNIALPSAQGFEEWGKADIIVDVNKGEGFNGMMIGGVTKSTEKLYRGKMKELHIGENVFKNVPIMTGGVDYLLLPFKIISNLGRIIIDYPNKRYHFTAYSKPMVWEGDIRPVQTGVMDGGVLQIAAVWGNEAMKELSVGDTITALDGKTLGNLPVDAPNVDVLINQVGAKTVFVKKVDGTIKQFPVTLFLPK